MNNKKLFFIIGFGFLVYFKTLFFGFTYLDDNVLILDNFYFIKSFANIFKSFGQDVFFHGPDAYYRPLLTISLILDSQLSQTSPFFYHLTNLNLHLIASCLLFIFLGKLKIKKELSFLFSLFFSLHPVLTQAVAWIPGRNDSLVTIFILSSFIFFIDFLKEKILKFFSYHLLFFFLALFTKEIAILLPLILCLYLWSIYKKSLSLNLKMGLTFGWFIILTFLFLLRSSALQNPIKYAFFDILKSLFLNSKAVFLYLGKLIFPVNLSVLPILQDSNFIYGILAFILITIFLVLSKNKRVNYIIFGIIWFLVFLLPSFIRPNPNIVADFIEHRVYLPMIGFIIVLLEIDWIKNLSIKKKNNLIVIGLILAVFSFLTFKHSHNFKNKIVFWQNAVKTSPHHPLAHRNLGAMYYLDKKLDQAEKEYFESLKLNPLEPIVHNNLGLIYMNQDLFERSENEFKEELKVNPYYDNTHFNLGLLYYKQGKKDEAVNWWQKTIKINPDYASAYINLGLYYYQQKDFEKACFYFLEGRKRGGQVPPDFNHCQQF